MAVIMAGDFRNGVTFELDNGVYRVVEFQHVKPGKGSPFVRVRMKNAITGSVVERTFNPSDKIQTAEIEKKDMQYLYSDGENYNFMDNATYEQIALTEETLGDSLKFIKENVSVTMLLYKGKVFAVEPPTFVELEITYTEPGFKGNTSSGTTKPATLETGAQINVPLFVNTGDKIKIDTRTSEYMERV